MSVSASAFSPGPPTNAVMLSPRAAAFSVHALLTGPEESEEDRLTSGAKMKSREKVAVEEVSEALSRSPPEAEETAATRPHYLEDNTQREETPPREAGDAGSDKEASSCAGEEDTDDEDLLVDVEDCSSEYNLD